MPTGDLNDMVARMAAVLPSAWFPAGAAVLRDALLTAAASCGTLVHDLVQFAGAQLRVATASGGWLDLIAYDFFGRALPRRGLGDDSYRLAIRRRLLRQGGTRAGLAAELLVATGRDPAIIEPWRPADCGAWGGGVIAIGYGAAGAWGSLLPCQAFVTIPRGGAAAADLLATVADMAPAGAGVWTVIRN
ncbi:conserved protein of unknown function [Rhodovastum atsumiense]|uniref:Phage tail protein n=1 Tax=Rhodovastum atsumiense TaxID=504468 RepID=A0A5M6J079_9PROT|nr:hypothetical protein [Rhodovastum atsumiense]KAA5613487.1 hypothetical protein F1189_05375 [Rhodovastum atsumiense]CAH2603231.1 conserved protein of unknown function [Rhodovastum atsumiense]